MFKWISYLFLSLLLQTASADEFMQDVDLVAKLQENHVRLIVVRQGEAINNAKKIVSSSLSPGYSLTRRGLQQVERMKELFQHEPVSKIFTSPLYRCLQNTQILGASLNLTPDALIVDSRLVIQNFGENERTSYNDYEESFKSKKEMLEAAREGIESGKSVYDRTRDLLWQIANFSENTTIMLITHAFNYCHISKILTGEYGRFPAVAEHIIYDFN